MLLFLSLLLLFLLSFLSYIVIIVLLIYIYILIYLCEAWVPKRYTGHPGCAASLRLPSLYRDGYLKKVHLVTALQTYCDHFSPLGNVIVFLLHENHTCCWQCAWLGPTLGWKLLLPLPLSTNRHMDSTAKVENFLRTAVRNGIMPGSSKGCIEIAAGWGVKHTISMYSIAIPTWMIPFLYAANQAESTQLAAKSF